MTRLGTIREELKLSKMISIEGLWNTRKESCFEEDESFISSQSKIIQIDPVIRFTRKRSNSMFASFQNLIKKDEDNIKLLLPLEKDDDLNLPIADAVLEIQLEYMDKFTKTNIKKFMRRKS